MGINILDAKMILGNDYLNDVVNRLRNKEYIRKYDYTNKQFEQIQINKKDNRICWQRFISADKQNWIPINNYLSLKDIIIHYAVMKKNNIERIKYTV